LTTNLEKRLALPLRRGRSLFFEGGSERLPVSGNIVSAKIFEIRLAALILGINTDYFATYNVKHFQEIEGLNPLTPPQILAALSVS
jgi:hypothetical protein